MVNEMRYDRDYYYNLLRMQAEHAQHISDVRWAFVHECGAKTVLDYGCGVGFFKAFAPSNIEVDTYDIGPYVMTGIKHKKYDLACLWDVIEHVDWKRNPDMNIESTLMKAKYVAVTVPILPVGKKLKDWKHWKPKEHLIRFKSIDHVISFFKKRGFKLVKMADIENPPREDIYNFLFKRKQC